MSTLGNFIELETQKGMIRHIIKNSELDLSENELTELAIEVQNKLLYMHTYRERLRLQEEGSLDKVAEEYGTDAEAVLDSFVYFSLVLECVWLKKKLDKLKQEE